MLEAEISTARVGTSAQADVNSHASGTSALRPSKQGRGPVHTSGTSTGKDLGNWKLRNN